MPPISIREAYRGLLPVLDQCPAFFETPVALRSDQPRLYALLADFFKLDPALLLEG